MPQSSPRLPVPAGDLAWGVYGFLGATVAWSFVLSYGASVTYLSYGLLCTGLALTLVVRRRWVIGSFVATMLLLAALALLVGLTPRRLGVSPLLVCAPLSVMAVTRHARSPWWGRAGLALGIAGSFASPALTLQLSTANIGLHVLVMVGCYLWALNGRTLDDAHRRDLAQQAEELRRDAAERVRTATDAERLRLAREVHDIVAHSLTVVKVQSSTGLAIGTQEQMRESLTAVRDASATALGEVRGLVGVLRGGTDDLVPGGELAQLDQLVENARAAGVDLAAPSPVVNPSSRERWPAAVRLTVLRVVQEALVNVVRHAGPRPSAELSLVETDGVVHVRVSSSGPPATHSGGFGLTGLRERAQLLGGSLDAGPDPEGGFTVDARIPAGVEGT